MNRSTRSSVPLTLLLTPLTSSFGARDSDVDDEIFFIFAQMKNYKNYMENCLLREWTRAFANVSHCSVSMGVKTFVPRIFFFWTILLFFCFLFRSSLSSSLLSELLLLYNKKVSSEERSNLYMYPTIIIDTKRWFSWCEIYFHPQISIARDDGERGGALIHWARAERARVIHGKVDAYIHTHPFVDWNNSISCLWVFWSPIQHITDKRKSDKERFRKFYDIENLSHVPKKIVAIVFLICLRFWSEKLLHWKNAEIIYGPHNDAHFNSCISFIR